MTQKRANFERIANKRVNIILNNIARLRAFRNTSFYEANNNDFAKIYKAISNELEDTYNYLKNGKKKGGKFEL